MKMMISTVILLIASAQWICGEYLGCYQDNEVRLLPDYYSRMHWTNSPERCLRLCQLLQFQYAGLEVGHECQCGSNMPYQLMKKDDSECNEKKCPYTDIPCGGGWRISVYSSDSMIYPTTDPGTYIGCYLEPKNDRVINNLQLLLWQINSPKRCVHLCTVLGYMYAGVDPNFYCYCGNTKPVYSRKTEDSECQVTCPHSKEKCGGDGKIAAYRTSVNSNAESIITVSDERFKINSLGCYEDSDPPVLPEFYIGLDDTNSPKNCLYLCQQLHYQYAGVENVNQCYCGNKKPSPTRKRNEIECNKTCPYSSEMCGGKLRIDVYSTQMFPNLSHSGLNITAAKFP